MTWLLSHISNDFGCISSFVRGIDRRSLLVTNTDNKKQTHLSKKERIMKEMPAPPFYSILKPVKSQDILKQDS